jgi:glycosyltransferase involved in cell wall biosynthesis
VGGLPEVIIDEETGLLVDRTPESVTQKLRWMLAHRSELSRFGGNGFERINQMFARKNTAAEIDALYHKILSV